MPVDGAGGGGASAASGSADGAAEAAAKAAKTKKTITGLLVAFFLILGGGLLVVGGVIGGVFYMKWRQRKLDGFVPDAFASINRDTFNPVPSLEGNYVPPQEVAPTPYSAYEAAEDL